MNDADGFRAMRSKIRRIRGILTINGYPKLIKTKIPMVVKNEMGEDWIGRVGGDP